MKVCFASQGGFVVSKDFFQRSSMEVAIDLGLRRLRFSREGRLYSPEDTKEILITSTVPYGTEGGYVPERKKGGELKKSLQGAFRGPGLIDMYFTPYGFILAISTDSEGKYSEVSIHGASPIRGSNDANQKNLASIVHGPLKLTKELGIDREIAKMLDGQPIYANGMIEISDDKLAGGYSFDPKKISPGALGVYRFVRS